MSYVDQFAAGFMFDFNKVNEFKSQSIWKSIFYVMLIVLLTGILRAFLGWNQILDEVARYLDVSYDGAFFAAVFFQYFEIAFDLIIHFVLISALAMIGLGFKNVGDVTYKELWTVNAYGISAPILFRLMIQMLGFVFPGLLFVYWLVVSMFSIFYLKWMVKKEQK